MTKTQAAEKKAPGKKKREKSDTPTPAGNVNALLATGGRDLRETASTPVRLYAGGGDTYSQADPLTRNMFISRAIREGLKVDPGADPDLRSVVLRLEPDAFALWTAHSGANRNAWLGAGLQLLEAEYMLGRYQLKMQTYGPVQEMTYGAGEGRVVHRALARLGVFDALWLQRPPVKGAGVKGVRALADGVPLWELRDAAGQSVAVFRAPSAYDAVQAVLNGTMDTVGPEILNPKLHISNERKKLGK